MFVVAMVAGASYLPVTMHEMAETYTPHLVVYQQDCSPNGRLVAVIGCQEESALGGNDMFAVIRPASTWRGMQPSDPIPSDAIAVGDDGVHLLSLAWHGNNALVIGYDDDGYDTDFTVRRTHSCGVHIVSRYADKN